MDVTLEKIYGMTETERQAADQHLMVGAGTPGPTLVKGEGVRMWDIDGNSYIDCTSQSWAMYLGFSNTEINQVVSEHMEQLSHVHQGFGSLSRLYLAQLLADKSPDGLDRVSYSVGGATAIEAAMKIAMRNRPGAKEFISLWDAYHGLTFGSASLSWVATHAAGRYTGQKHYVPWLETVHRVPNPYCYRCIFDEEPETCGLMCAEMLRHTLEKSVNGQAAGFILEPVQASGGQIPAPQRYLERVREICDEYEVPLIFDEIQTFCRVGEWFAAEHYGVTPDAIAVAKGLGAGLPIAATIIRDTMDGFGPDVEEGHTFGNNTVAQVAAIKQIEIIERDDILKHTRHMGDYFASGLKELQVDFPEMGDIRVVGLHVGVEYVNDPVSKEPSVETAVQIRKEGMKLGAFFGLGGANRNVLKIKPPLVIEENEADEVLDILKQSMVRVLRQ